MEHSNPHIAVPYLIETVAFLLTVVVIVPLFKKLKISPILGYLAVGAIIGPHSIALVKDAQEVQHLAELGVIFLLFTIGLELSFDRLRSYSKLIFGLGTMQVLFSALAIGAVAVLWGNPVEASIIIGLCLALSSTAMVVQLLKESGQMSATHGRTSFAVLLLQDLAVVPILILLSVFGSQSDQNIWHSIAISLIHAFSAVGLIIILGRYVLRYLFRVASKTNSVDVFTATMLLTILAISLATGLAGLSMALGAFLAGLLLAETEFRHQIEVEIEPFKGLLLGLFFMGVGMNLDFIVAFEHGIWVLASVFGLITIKAIIGTLLSRCFKLTWTDSMRTGLLLSEAGEFAFVVIGQATLAYDLIDQQTGQFMIIVAGISMILTPALAALGNAIAKRKPLVEKYEQMLLPENEELHNHVIIGGFGRVGKSVAAVLKSQSVPYIALDMNIDNVKKFRESDEPIYYGDAARPELLENAGADHASVLLITMDDPISAENAVSIAKEHWPELPIVVRARDTGYKNELIAAGANAVVPEPLEASLQLSGHVLEFAGMQKHEVEQCVQLIRAHNYQEIIHPKL